MQHTASLDQRCLRRSVCAGGVGPVGVSCVGSARAGRPCWPAWPGMVALRGRPTAGRRLSRRFCRMCKNVFVHQVPTQGIKVTEGIAMIRHNPRYFSLFSPIQEKSGIDAVAGVCINILTFPSRWSPRDGQTPRRRKDPLPQGARLPEPARGDGARRAVFCRTRSSTRATWSRSGTRCCAACARTVCR